MVEYREPQRAQAAAVPHALNQPQAKPVVPNGFQQMQAALAPPSPGTLSTSTASPTLPMHHRFATTNNEPTNPASHPIDLQKEKECVQVTLYINSELLRESLRISASMDGDAEEKQRNPHYMACLQRLQMNLAYLASVADRSHKPQDPLLRRGPQNLQPPPTMPQLKNAYKRLKVLLNRDDDGSSTFVQASHVRGTNPNQFVSQSGNGEYFPPTLNRNSSFTTSTQSPTSTANGNSPMLAQRNLSPGLQAGGAYSQSMSGAQPHHIFKQERTDVGQMQRQEFLQQQRQQSQLQLEQQQQVRYQQQPHLQLQLQQQQQRQQQQHQKHQQQHQQAFRQRNPQIQEYYYNSNPVAGPQPTRQPLQEPSPPPQHLMTPGAQYLESQTSAAETNGNHPIQRILSASPAQSAAAQTAAQNNAYNLRWQPTQGSSTFKVQPY